MTTETKITPEEWEAAFKTLVKEALESARLHISADVFRVKESNGVYGVYRKPHESYVCHAFQQDNADFVANALNLLLVALEDLKEHQQGAYAVAELIGAPDTGMGVFNKCTAMLERIKELEEQLDEAKKAFVEAAKL